ncbi:MAG: HEPN domain-containing protein [Imperialibacter sp.]
MKVFDSRNGKALIKYGVILNDINIDTETSLDLGDWIMATATKEEISEFRPMIWKFILPNSIGPRQEMKIDFGGQRMEALSEIDDFRYLVIRPKQAGNLDSDADLFAQACRISDADIWIGFYAFEHIGGFSFSFEKNVAFFSKPISFDPPKSINLDHLVQVIEYRKALPGKKFPEIDGAIKMFIDQDTIQDTSPLKHLGYFSIIESLLSHKPAPSDSADSITRQLKRNLLLLENRMSEPYNLMLNQFNGCKADKVITQLYDYRSRVAHAEPVEVTLKWLFDNRPEHVENVEFATPRTWIGWYLRKLTQRVLVHALKEPRLVMDLK